jgi:predicted AAA+ superfamily ATPase
LLQEFLATTPKKTVFYRGDELRVQTDFSLASTEILAPLIGDREVLVIDEAQMIPNIGKTLKLIIDTQPQLSVVVTGSSAFELSGQLGEPLTGRKETYQLLPIAVHEVLANKDVPLVALQKSLTEYLRFGMYPSVITAKTHAQKERFLAELVDSYLLKDILTFREIKGSRTILQLLVLLAYQIGSEVSLSELGSSLQIDRKTVERYLDLLEKTFVVFRIGGYSRNLRSEVTKMAKYYFYDIGVRNAIIHNHNALEFRNDIGQLWENFVIVERLKRRLYWGPSANQYFWRTWQGAEVDLVEERGGKLYGYECKWSSTKRHAAPPSWLTTYPDTATWQLITPSTVLDFVTPAP